MEVSRPSQDDLQQWRADNMSIISKCLARGVQGQPLEYHMFMSHRQVGGGSETKALNKGWQQLGLSCWFDQDQSVQDTTAMVRGVAVSSVYTLYLTSDALSEYVLLEAWAAMTMNKPVIVLTDDDDRKQSYAGASLGEILEDWPKDLQDYFRNHGKIVAWSGQPIRWSTEKANGTLRDILKWCEAKEKAGLARVPAHCYGWDDAISALDTQASSSVAGERPLNDRSNGCCAWLMGRRHDHRHHSRHSSHHRNLRRPASRKTPPPRRSP